MYIVYNKGAASNKAKYKMLNYWYSIFMLFKQ